MLIYNSLPLTSLPFTLYRLHFPSLVFTFLNLVLKICVLPWEVPIATSGSCFQSVMDLFTKEYFPMSVLRFVALIQRTDLRLTATSNRWCSAYLQLFLPSVCGTRQPDNKAAELSVLTDSADCWLLLTIRLRRWRGRSQYSSGDERRRQSWKDITARQLAAVEVPLSRGKKRRICCSTAMCSLKMALLFIFEKSCD